MSNKMVDNMVNKLVKKLDSKNIDFVDNYSESYQVKIFGITTPDYSEHNSLINVDEDGYIFEYVLNRDDVFNLTIHESIDNFIKAVS